jgi:hypothetical protein
MTTHATDETVIMQLLGGDMAYLWYTIRQSKYGPGYDVHGFKEADKNSVLEGQTLKCFVAVFDTLEDAQSAYPQAKMGSEWTDPQVSLNHLPDDGGW